MQGGNGLHGVAFFLSALPSRPKNNIEGIKKDSKGTNQVNGCNVKKTGAVLGEVYESDHTAVPPLASRV